MEYYNEPELIIRHYENFNSEHVAPRNIDVLLPPFYQEDNHYPVIYMHDGQNLFDPSTSYVGIDWGVDEAILKLLGENKINPAIVVGIWNTPQRMTEYMPSKAFDLLSPKEKDHVSRVYKHFFNVNLEPVLSDNYLKFIVQELKPFIDSNYSTLKDRQNTFIMGSSMGALISIYALSEYPEIFGGAGCVSTHWPAGNGIVIEYLKEHLPDPGKHRIYFDFGTKTLDKEYEPFQDKMDEIIKAKGYSHGDDWITMKFPGAEHSESAWRERVSIPLHFFLGKSEWEEY